jgi:hypothetical protein
VNHLIRSYRTRRSDDPFLHRLMTGHNLMDRRNKLLSYPLRKAAPYIKEALESDKLHVTLSGLGLAAYAAVPTFFGNVVLPMNLISSGFKPQPVLEGLSHYKVHVHIPTRSHWLEPMFSVKHGSSKAFKAGARVGGKVGGRIGARLIPGIGYGLLAYDVYDVVVNRSLWGFDLE